MSHAGTNISKKKKFALDGVFYAELNEFLARELAEEGYSGLEIRPSPAKTEIIIRATRTKSVLGNQGHRIRELTSLVQKRFRFVEGSVELFADRVQNRALCAMAQAESLKYKLIAGLAVRRACYGVLRFIMDGGALGAQVTVSGKSRGARAKALKFMDGYMLRAGQPSFDFVDTAVRHVNQKQGTLGVKVEIMRPTRKSNDPILQAKPLPDAIKIHEPKDDMMPVNPADTSRPGRAAGASAHRYQMGGQQQQQQPPPQQH